MGLSQGADLRDRGEMEVIQGLRHRRAERRRQELRKEPGRLADCRAGDIVRTLSADVTSDREEWVLLVVDHLVDTVAVRRVSAETLRPYGRPFSLSGERGCTVLVRS